MRFLAVFTLIVTVTGCSGRPARQHASTIVGQPRSTEAKTPAPSSATDPDAALAEMEAASEPRPETAPPSPPAVTEEAKRPVLEPPPKDPEAPKEPAVVIDTPPVAPQQPAVEIPPLFEERWASVISHVRLELQKYKRW